MNLNGRLAVKPCIFQKSNARITQNCFFSKNRCHYWRLTYYLQPHYFICFIKHNSAKHVLKKNKTILRCIWFSAIRIFNTIVHTKIHFLKNIINSIHLQKRSWPQQTYVNQHTTAMMTFVLKIQFQKIITAKTMFLNNLQTVFL